MYQPDPTPTAFSVAPSPAFVGGGDQVTTMLRDVPVTVRIGIAPKERRAPQRLLVTVEMISEPPQGGYQSITDCVDYDRIFRHLRDVWPNRPHTDLLEQLMEGLLAFIFEDPKVLACRARLIKPDIYPGSAQAGIERSAVRTAPPAPCP